MHRLEKSIFGLASLLVSAPGAGEMQDHTARLEFRNIKIRQLAMKP